MCVIIPIYTKCSTVSFISIYYFENDYILVLKEVVFCRRQRQIETTDGDHLYFRCVLLLPLAFLCNPFKYLEWENNIKYHRLCEFILIKLLRIKWCGILMSVNWVIFFFLFRWFAFVSFRLSDLCWLSIHTEREAEWFVHHIF
jgi:hypothetical protein